MISHVASGMQELLHNQQTIQENDIYLRYLFNGQQDLSHIQMNRIKPCTLIHIKKYTQGIFKRVRETPELYEKHVVPYIQSLPPSRTAWIDKGNNFSERCLQLQLGSAQQGSRTRRRLVS